VPGAQVYGARHLLDVVQQFALPGRRGRPTVGRLGTGGGHPPDRQQPVPDLADVKGQVAAGAPWRSLRPVATAC
jgi:magnesium chelatase family protein